MKNSGLNDTICAISTPVGEAGIGIVRLSGKKALKIADKICGTGREKLGAFIGDDSRTGVNVSLMPGVRVGPRAVVGSHVCLSKDLGEDMAAFAQEEVRVMKRETALDFDKRNDFRRKLEG